MKNFLLVLCLAFGFGEAAAGTDTRICVLLSADLPQYRQAYDGFREAVWEKKSSLQIVEHNLEKEDGGLILQTITQRAPILVIGIGPEAARFARDKIREIPSVFAMVLRPQSLANNNATWVSLEIPVQEKLERARRILPGLRRVGVIYSSGNASLYRDRR